MMCHLVSLLVRRRCRNLSLHLQFSDSHFVLNITCPANLSPGLIALMLCGREYGLRRSCLCIYLHSLYMSFLEPNILHITITSAIT